jgi:hypothetical protein
MNFLSLLFGVSTVAELKGEFADELAAEEVDGLVGDPDETYPAKKGGEKRTSTGKTCVENKKENSRNGGRTGSLSEVLIFLSSGVSPDSSVGTQPSRERWRSRSSFRCVAWTTGLLTITTPTTTSCRIE